MKTIINDLENDIRILLKYHTEAPWEHYQTTYTCDELMKIAQESGLDKVKEILRRDSIRAHHLEEGANGML